MADLSPAVLLKSTLAFQINTIIQNTVDKVGEDLKKWSSRQQQKKAPVSLSNKNYKHS